MIKWISFRDVLRAYPQFKNEVGLLPLESQRFIEDELYELGFDTSIAIEVRECLHTDWFGERAVGWQYVGKERQDPEWLRNPKSSMSIHLYRHKDTSLIAELLALNQEDVGQASFYRLMNVCATRDAQGNFTVALCDLEPDYEENTNLLAEMKLTRERVREYYDTLGNDAHNSYKRDLYGNRLKQRKKQGIE